MQDKLRISARASAAAIGLAGGLMVLASTQPQAFASSNFDLGALFVHSSASNPSGDAFLDIFDGELRRDPSGGIVYANKFGGPMGVYGSFLTKDEPDLVSVGGPESAAQLTSLLNSTGAHPKGDIASLTPSTVASESYSTANSNVLNVFADPATMNDHLAQQKSPVESRPTIDDHGEVDCAGALTCRTDPSTQTTTVTYPDGVVAVVQKVNNLTVVAYNAIRDGMLGTLERLVPTTDVEASAPMSPAPTGAGASPTQNGPAEATDLALPPPNPTEPETAPSVGSAAPGDNNPRPVVALGAPDAGAPDALAAANALAAPNLEQRAKRGPLVNVLRPAPDFTPWRATRPIAAVHGMPDLPSAVRSALADLTDSVQSALNRTSVGSSAAETQAKAPQQKTQEEPTSTSNVSNPPTSPAERSGLRSAGESRTASPSARRSGTGSQSSNAPGRRAADSGVAGPARRHR